MLSAVRNAVARTPAGYVDGEVCDVASCRELLLAVIVLAIRDARVLENLEEKPVMTNSERKTVQELTRDLIPPNEFFESEWFKTICAMASVNPKTIRKRHYPRIRHGGGHEET